ncbi:MAG TPA: hypothetical protein DGB32_03000, partial [Dehalococcoidia bacterium]|nr:hypothetical protein [Dehalococcoidia bacterium]
LLDEHDIPYNQLNVDEDDGAPAEINKLQNGGRTVVDAEKYEEATRSLVRGRLWNFTPSNAETATYQV